MTDSDSDLNFAADLWRAADTIRGQLLCGDKRWEYGEPPVGNAYYAWIQHFIHHLAYPNGRVRYGRLRHGQRQFVEQP